MSAAAPPSVNPGTMINFAGATPPIDWLLCMGQAVSRTTYKRLFAAVGTQYGAGDGSTTFNVPDVRSCLAGGKEDMGGSVPGDARLSTMGGSQHITLGGKGGVTSHVLTIAEMPAHYHSYGWFTASTAGLGPGAVWVSTQYASQGAGSGAAHNNVGPTFILNKIIKT